MSRLSHRPWDPVYFIEDFWIYTAVAHREQLKEMDVISVFIGSLFMS